MGIKAVCPCGAQFMAKPELAGRTVQCPTCKQAFQVPGAAAPQPAKTFQVACGCGRTYQVQPAMAGRPVRCQACGQQFVVPQPPGTRQQTPAAPAPDPLADPLGDLGDLGDLGSFNDPLGGTLPGAGLPAQQVATPSYAPARGVSSNAKRKTGNKIPVVPIVVSALVVLAILGIAVGTFIFFPFGNSYSTPEAVWNAHKEATENQDWRTLYKTLTPQTQDQMVGAIVFMAQMLAAGDDGMQEIAKRHGLETQSMSNPGNIGQMFARMQEVESAGDSIQDKEAFFVDVMTYFMERGEEIREKMGGQQMSMMQASQELKDVVVDGDSARGMQTVSFMGNTVEVPIEFRKINGGWLIHQPTLQERMDQGPRGSPFGGSPSGDMTGLPRMQHAQSFKWSDFTGGGEPDAAARAAIAGLPGLVPGSVVVDANEKTIQLEVAGTNGNSDAAEVRLSAAGFQIESSSSRIKPSNGPNRGGQ